MWMFAAFHITRVCPEMNISGQRPHAFNYYSSSGLISSHEHNSVALMRRYHLKKKFICVFTLLKSTRYTVHFLFILTVTSKFLLNCSVQHFVSSLIYNVLQYSNRSSSWSIADCLFRPTDELRSRIGMSDSFTDRLLTFLRKSSLQRLRCKLLSSQFHCDINCFKKRANFL